MHEMLIILILIAFNGILAMSEIALISTRKINLENEVRRGNKSAKLALKLANEPDRFLSTVQIGITIIGILTGLYSGDVLASDFARFLIDKGISATYAHTIAQGIIVAFVTYLTLIFGELVPKKIGMTISDRTAKLVARPMYILSLISLPFVWILAKSSAFIFNMMGISEKENKITEAEIKLMVQEGTRVGEVQEVEQDIVERVFWLGDLKISSLMTHRTEIVWLEQDMTKEEIKTIMQTRIYEIYPVADTNLDTIKGIVTLKDLIRTIEKPDFNLSEIIRPAVSFDQNTYVYEVLEAMKEQRITQALVKDEFGSCEGLITAKDILNGLVGAFADRRQEPEIVLRKDGKSWLVDGKCSFYEFLSFFNKEYLFEETNHFHTLSGLILQLLDHIPVAGEWVTWEDFTFEIVDMDGIRIDKILVTITTP